MISAGEFTRGYTFLRCLYSNWSAVAVTAGDIQHSVAFGTVIAGQDISRQNTRKPAQVQGAIGIRPSPSDKNVCHVIVLL